MKNLEYIGCQVYKKDEYDKWKVMVLYKEYLPEGETREIGSTGAKIDYNIKHRFLYPFMSGYYRGKWTYHPANISEEEQEIQKFCKETWTDRFKEGYKRWRESVGPWVE